MNNDSPQKAVLVVFCVALACSLLVSLTAITLRPVQLRNQLIERSRNVVALTGLTDRSTAVTDAAVLSAIEQLDIRVVDIDAGEFAVDIDPAGFDPQAAASDPELAVSIPATQDVAGLGKRPRHAVVYLVWKGAEFSRIVLPISGQGMWAMIRGYIPLESDLNTIAAISFYEQAETAGLGDQILRPDWQARWQGKQLYGRDGELQFRIGGGAVNPDLPAAAFQVDGLSGATVTGDAVNRMVSYWFGPHGYAPLLRRLATDPPVQPASTEEPAA